MLELILADHVVLSADVLSDAYRADKKQIHIDHDTETILAVCVFVLLGILHVLMIGTADIAHIVVSRIMLIPYRWVFHDLMLNLVRGLPIDYLGSGTKSAYTDKLLRMWELDGYTQWFVKLFLFGFCSAVSSLVLIINHFLT